MYDLQESAAEPLAGVSGLSSSLVPEPSTPSALPVRDEYKERLERKNRALRMQVYRLQRKLKSIKILTDKQRRAKQLDKLENLLKDFLSGPQLSFVLAQIKASTRKVQGYRWTNGDKSFALSLIHSSPKTYRLLKKVFTLPSVRTLKRCMTNMEMYPGFSESILQSLEMKVRDLPAAAKVVCITMDEMAIREGVSYDRRRDVVEGLCDQQFVNHAIVFVVKGIIHRWKQPIGYFFSSSVMSGDQMQKLLYEAIERLNAMELTVKVVVCDQGSNNVNLIQSKLGVTPDKPYFVHQQNKVFIFYDPPHLIKNIRNNLKKQGFLVGKDSVQWDHISTFYEKDSSKPIRLAPKLTRKHIFLPPFSQLRVKLATQVLSHSVASGITFMVQWGLMDAEASHTAAFIEKFDQLFNCFNSSTLTSTAKMRHAYSSTSGHTAFLKQTLEWLESVRSKGSRKLPCMKGWKLTIQALLQLYDDLRESHDVKFIYTRQLNQDVVENLFSVIRSKGGARDNPDASQFRGAICQVMVDAIFSPGKMSNCEEDVEKFLLSLHSQHTSTKLILEDKHSHQTGDELLTTDSVGNINFEEQNVLTYIGGYVVRKLRSKVCTDCQSRLATNTADGSDPRASFLEAKNYGDAKEGLLRPSAALTSVLDTCETRYRQIIDNSVHQCQVKHSLVSELLSCADTSALRCESCQLPHSVVSLFVNIRFHHTLRQMNVRLSEEKQRKNRKLLKFSHL